jgi:hypothetical protein
MPQARSSPLILKTSKEAFTFVTAPKRQHLVCRQDYLRIETTIRLRFTAGLITILEGSHAQNRGPYYLQHESTKLRSFFASNIIVSGCLGLIAIV